MKYLNHFKSGHEIYLYLDKLKFPWINWRIYDMEISERTKLISKNKYYQTIIKQAEENKIQFDETEIISWLDNLNLLHHILCGNRKILDNFKDFDLFQELCIPFSNKRADVVIIKNNKILIIEFSYNKWNIEYRYENKLHQAIGYKELLQNVLSSNVQIGTYTFLNKPDDKDVNVNEEECDNLRNFILHYFNNSNIDIIEQLKKIEE